MAQGRLLTLFMQVSKRFSSVKCSDFCSYGHDFCNFTNLQNMWDLTPDTDLLQELPAEYTFETALADLIVSVL